MPIGLTFDHQRLTDICRRHHVLMLELFGSRATGAERPDSDVDLLVTFEPGMTPGLTFFQLALELESLFGRPIDLFTRPSVEQSFNEYKRAAILSSVERLYVAA